MMAASDTSADDKRKLLEKRWQALKNERESWMPHYRELSNFLLPRSGRFFVQDRNRGGRRHNDILDNEATRGVRVLAAGMMSGMTSPARPWFRMATGDPLLDKQPDVKEWLSEVTRLMLAVFAKSNTYRALHSTYEELAVFGTSAKILVDDFDTVIHHHSLTAGEYCISTDYKGNVNTLFREFEKTVAATVAEFGRVNCSDNTRAMYDRGELDKWVPICHAIEPRIDRDERLKDARNMAFKSVYFETGAADGRFLREGGFKDFAGLCSRWATSGGDIYGNGPGMEALGDVKQLQHEQLRKGQGIDFMTKPPLVAPTAMKGQQINMLPGGVTFMDVNGGKVQPLFEVGLDLSHLLADIQDVRHRIKSSFYADLWLLLQDAAEGKMTATEVAERKEEKLLMLGPTTERLHNEELTPLIDATFARLVAAGALPPAPAAMHGRDLNVEFVSMLAQAQRAIGTNSIDRFVANLGQIATFKPGVLDKFSEDEWADRYSDALGIDPNLIVGSDKVAIVRKSRADAAAAAQKAAMANSAADTANKLAGASMSSDNALGAIAQGAGGTLARGADQPLDITRATSGYV